MKRIVILCDGTWNRSDSEHPTNVVRVAQGLRPFDATGVAQVPIYLAGVGQGQGVTALSRLSDRILGGAFGLGLMDNVIDAYRHLVFLYEPGDEVFVFGFSRGAFTARSLTGFVRSTGIVPRDGLDRIPAAVARYRTRGRRDHRPSSDDSLAFRAETMGSRVATGGGEAEDRRRLGLPDVPRLRIAYLGVWDTVGALGVPATVPGFGWTRRRHRFHDAELSSLVASARHAVALDERRRSFAPTAWSNLGDMRDEAIVEGRPGDAYAELHFAGDHGSVGGGGDVTALSSIALRWIVEGAMEAGLSFDERWLHGVRGEADHMGSLRNRTVRIAGFGDRVTRWFPKDRVGPPAPAGLHRSVLDRWLAERKDGLPGPRYRPAALRHLEAVLESMREGDAPG